MLLHMTVIGLRMQGVRNVDFDGHDLFMSGRVLSYRRTILTVRDPNKIGVIGKIQAHTVLLQDIVALTDP